MLQNCVACGQVSDLLDWDCGRLPRLYAVCTWAYYSVITLESMQLGAMELL